MAFTKDDLDAINEAIASGELTVVVDGKTLTYRSVAELLAAKRHICAELAGQAGKRRSAFAGFAVHIDRGIR